MAISAAKLEANRRNAQKSTGPRTREGKERAKLNPVKHGMRAETLVLLDEDPQVLADRREAWRACLSPGDEIELRAVDDAVEHSWMQDRARRAQTARIATDIAKAGVDEARREADEVLRLGQKLFSDNRAPLATYPHLDVEKDYYPPGIPRVSHSNLVDDPEDPQRLVLHLQATAGGCQWMLEQWSKLRSILDEGLNWQSADKLKAVRLLGRHPLEAADDRSVLMLFVACQKMEGQPVTIVPEIWHELREYERKTYAQRLRGRGVERLAPADAAAARRALFDIIERASAQIRVKAEEHRLRAEIIDTLAVDRLAFDDSPAAERLRRYELASGRGVARSLELLIKLRRLRGSSSVAHRDVQEICGPDRPNEPTEIQENATNEPTEIQENATNEPTELAGHAFDESIEDVQPAGSCEAEAVASPAAPDEPAEAQENRTNEPALAASDRDLTGTRPGTEPNDGIDHNLEAEFDIEKANEWLRQGLEKQKPIRAERLRKLNEQARRDAGEAAAARRSRAAGPKKKSRNATGQPKGRKASNAPSRRREIEAREMRELDHFLSILRGTPNKASPGRK